VADPAEIGVTNLGPVPDGMEFFEALSALRDQRKYRINIDHESRRLTYCEVMREICREAAKPDPDLDKITDLAAAGFDFGKRMNQRMIDLKAGNE
jgi:hypothetical protein